MMAVILSLSMSQQIGKELPEVEPLMSPEKGPTGQEVASALPGESIYSEKQATKALEQGAPSRPQPGAATQKVLAQFAASGQPSSTTTQTSNGAPQIADDTDLIEKEWVLKAKEIVEHTKHDPYQQNKGVERLKADYMQKRYNREIKLTED